MGSDCKMRRGKMNLSESNKLFSILCFVLQNGKIKSLVPAVFFFLPQKHCDRQKANLRIRFKPSLFQHVGTHSSLAGKIQKLKVSREHHGYRNEGGEKGS